MKHLIIRALFSIALFAFTLCFRASAQYSIDWYKISGGGGTSTDRVYSVSGTIGQPDAGGPMIGADYSLTGGFWAVVPTPGAPSLFITLAGNNVVLSWSTNATDFVLENNSNLAVASGWSAVSPLPVSANGFNYVTNTIKPGNNFYRLRRL
jgi:hypothetical protein